MLHFAFKGRSALRVPVNPGQPWSTLKKLPFPQPPFPADISRSSLPATPRNPDAPANSGRILDCAGKAQRRRRFRTHAPAASFGGPSPARKRRGALLPAAVHDAPPMTTRPAGMVHPRSSILFGSGLPSRASASLRFTPVRQTFRRIQLTPGKNVISSNLDASICVGARPRKHQP